MINQTQNYCCSHRLESKIGGKERTRVKGEKEKGENKTEKEKLPYVSVID